MDNEEKPVLDLGAFDFTPAWARKDAGVVVGKTTPQRDQGAFAGGRGGAGGRGEGRPQGDGRGRFGDGRGRFGGEGRGPAPRRDGFGGGRGGFGGRPGPDGRGRPFERPQPLDADVKILPEPKALGTIIRKLQQDSHAYKLKELAYFFLDNPSSVLLKITPRKPQDAAANAKAPAKEPPRFSQCKACGFASTSEADVVAHLVAAHLSDYYDAKEIDAEPPKGNFNCVAKCGLSGVLLGPPNIHEFNSTVREMIRTKYPNMSEAEYRSHIEMIRDPEAIEEWRKGAVKKTVFTAKGAGEGAAQLTREQAEAEFKRTILPSMLDAPKNLMITADLALKSPVKSLQWAAKDALEAERRAPYAMCFALRGAFHHRKMHFFRANDARGQEFVTGVELREFDAEHAIPELAKVAGFVAAHPCSTKAEIVADDPEGEKQLAWLVSTGHVVAFTNGVFSAVEKFPKYGPQWRKAKDKANAEESPADATRQDASSPCAAPETPTPDERRVEGNAPYQPADETSSPDTPPRRPDVAATAGDRDLSRETSNEKTDETPSQLA